MILAINTETFVGISYDEAVNIIKSLGGKVKMLVTNPREEESKKAESEAKPPLQPRREDPPKAVAAKQTTAPGAQSKPEAAPAKKEEAGGEGENKVEIVKDQSGLGLSIVGGTDTPLVSDLTGQVRSQLSFYRYSWEFSSTRSTLAAQQRSPTS